MHDDVFKQVKELISSNLVLKPINHVSNEQIYLITDTTNVRLLGWIGQEEDSVIRPVASTQNAKTRVRQIIQQLIRSSEQLLTHKDISSMSCKVIK